MVIVTKCPKCGEYSLCNIESHGHATCGNCDYECSTDEFYEEYAKERMKEDRSE